MRRFARSYFAGEVVMLLAAGAALPKREMLFKYRVRTSRLFIDGVGEDAAA